MNWSFDAGCTAAEYVLTPRRSQSVEMRLISWLWTNHSRHLLNLDIKYLSKWCPLRRMIPGHLESGQTKTGMSDSCESFQRCLSVSLFPGNEEILCTASIIQQLQQLAACWGKTWVSLSMFYNTLGGCQLATWCGSRKQIVWHQVYNNKVMRTTRRHWKYNIKVLQQQQQCISFIYDRWVILWLSYWM